ncbi:MAG: DUF481 domain-containing protein [Deltaproteobacteria bacterium]|nr:DUF481 domain-containing protein [Deltaproteobacteria bacterium]
MKKNAALLLSLVVFFVPTAAAAQPDPKFAHIAAEKPIEAPVWKAQAKGGLVLSGGNSRSTTGSVGGDVSYKNGNHQVGVFGGLTYVESAAREFIVGADGSGGKVITGSERVSRTTSKRSEARGRYDRFWSANDSAYVVGQALTDEPAGKAIAGGGQIGYSRLAFKSEIHTVAAELGYDFSYEKAAASGAEGVPIHSGRVFVSDTLKLTNDTGLSAGVEVLSNLNEEKESKAGYVVRYGSLGPLKDTRVSGKLQLSTTLLSNVSFGFGFTARYDNRPGLVGLPGGVSDGGFLPRANKLDTLMEASLIVTFF